MTFLNSEKTLTVEAWLEALSEDIDNIIPKTEFFFNLGIIGNATSDFVFFVF